MSKKPHTVLALAPGVTLLYRPNKRNGTWVVKVLAGCGARSGGSFHLAWSGTRPDAIAMAR